eukprot:TRINITY_DN14501_c0_g1_i1.p4 TRINITY_DN14501_c0_g1~~TRINITY_DN14501_c0_g1_i1.p4  ORF type:complete len:151 (+),score=14.34 TRINITY_DN14501_c0_g1_i1:184-636(+)
MEETVLDKDGAIKCAAYTMTALARAHDYKRNLHKELEDASLKIATLEKNYHGQRQGNDGTKEGNYRNGKFHQRYEKKGRQNGQETQSCKVPNKEATKENKSTSSRLNTKGFLAYLAAKEEQNNTLTKLYNTVFTFNIYTNRVSEYKGNYF